MEYQENIQFDSKGQGVIRKSIPSLPVNINITAWISGLAGTFDVYLEQPEQEVWRGLQENQRITKTIKLKMGSTNIEARITSSIPNASATFHITA